MSKPNSVFKIVSIATQAFDHQLVVLENETARIEMHLKQGHFLDKDDAPDEVDFSLPTASHDDDGLIGVLRDEKAQLETKVAELQSKADQVPTLEAKVKELDDELETGATQYALAVVRVAELEAQLAQATAMNTQPVD